MDEMNEKTGAALAAILNGNASEAEKELINDWIREHPDDKKILDLLKGNSFHISTGNGEPFREKIFDRVQSKIAASQTRRTVRIWQWAAAASIALLISVSVFLTMNNNSRAEQLIETKCPEGSRSTVTLADGSVVELNSGSSISYPSAFKGKKRMVELKGEAFFKVTADKRRPFIVKAGGINVRVLGTQFNVKAYENETEVFTTLVEGSVRIEVSEKSDEHFVLVPGQQAVFNRNLKKLNIQKVNAGLYSAWKEGTIYFDSESLTEIAKRLQREFNVKIEIKSEELEKEVFSGVFDKGESVSQILDMLRKHRNFSYREVNKRIELYIEQ